MAIHWCNKNVRIKKGSMRKRIVKWYFCSIFYGSFKKWKTLNELRNFVFQTDCLSILIVFVFVASQIFIEYPLDWKSTPGLKIQLFLLFFFFFSNKKNAVNWTVKPCQDPLNPVRIGYIDIKRITSWSCNSGRNRQSWWALYQVVNLRW